MKAKPGELKAGWSRRECDILYDWGGNGANKCDAHLLHHTLTSKQLGVDFERSLIEELESRGYDLATLRFSIKRRALA